jgi:hypothetical protein
VDFGCRERGGELPGDFLRGFVHGSGSFRAKGRPGVAFPAGPVGWSERRRVAFQFTAFPPFGPFFERPHAERRYRVADQYGQNDFEHGWFSEKGRGAGRFPSANAWEGSNPAGPTKGGQPVGVLAMAVLFAALAIAPGRCFAFVKENVVNGLDVAGALDALPDLSLDAERPAVRQAAGAETDARAVAPLVAPPADFSSLPRQSGAFAVKVAGEVAGNAGLAATSYGDKTKARRGITDNAMSQVSENPIKKGRHGPQPVGPWLVAAGRDEQFATDDLSA